MSPDCPPPTVVQGVIHTTPPPPKSESSVTNQKVSSIKATKGLFQYCLFNPCPLYRFLFLHEVKLLNFHPRLNNLIKIEPLYFLFLFNSINFKRKMEIESKLMSPKSRTGLTKKHEKSPVLNVRKNNSINTALKANQTTSTTTVTTNQQQQQQQPHHHHANEQLQKKTLTHKTQTQTQSPKQQASYTVTPDNMSTVSSDDDSEHFSADKLKTIRNKAAQR